MNRYRRGDFAFVVVGAFSDPLATDLRNRYLEWHGIKRKWWVVCREGAANLRDDGATVLACRGVVGKF